MKSTTTKKKTTVTSPTPRGVGGLKYREKTPSLKIYPSHPSRGGWIEISPRNIKRRKTKVPPLAGWVD